MKRYSNYTEAIQDLRRRNLTISKIALKVSEIGDTAWEHIHGVYGDTQTLIKKIRRILKGDRIFSGAEDFESRILEVIDKTPIYKNDTRFNHEDGPNEFRLKWGEKLKETRKNFKLSMSNMASLFEVSESSIFRMEHGLEEFTSLQKSILGAMDLLAEFELSDFLGKQIAEEQGGEFQLKSLYLILKHIYENEEESSKLERGGIWMPDGLSLEEVKKHYIDHTVKQMNGNKAKAAVSLNIGSRTIYRRTDKAEET